MEPTPATETAPARRSLLTDTGSPLLPGLPRRPLTADQQTEALRKVQTQAEQRVKLGMQLFKSAESRLAAQSDMLERVRQEQKSLREQVQQDVAKSLQGYDQWMGQIDERFTSAMQLLEQKVDTMAQQWQTMREEMAALMGRSEALLDQSRCLIDQAQDRPHRLSAKEAIPQPDQELKPDPEPPLSHTAQNRVAGSSAPPESADPLAESDAQASRAQDSSHDDPGDQAIYSQILGQLRQQSDDDLRAESQA